MSTSLLLNSLVASHCISAHNSKLTLHHYQASPYNYLHCTHFRRPSFFLRQASLAEESFFKLHSPCPVCILSFPHSFIRHNKLFAIRKTLRRTYNFGQKRPNSLLKEISSVHVPVLAQENQQKWQKMKALCNVHTHLQIS